MTIGTLKTGCYIILTQEQYTTTVRKQGKFLSLCTAPWHHWNSWNGIMCLGRSVVLLSHRQELTWWGGQWWLWRSVPQHSCASCWARHIWLSQADETVVLFPFRKMEVIKRCGFRTHRIVKQQKAEQKLVIYASTVKTWELANQTDLSC